MLKGGQFKVKINHFAPPSRFLVNLASDFDLSEEEKRKISLNKSKKKQLQKGRRFNFNFLKFKKYLTALKGGSHQGRLRRLAVAQIGYALFFVAYRILRAFYSFSWRVGWLAVFFIRFFSLFFFKLFASLAKLDRRFWLRLKSKENKKKIKSGAANFSGQNSMPLSAITSPEKRIFSLPPIKTKRNFLLLFKKKLKFFFIALKPKPQKFYLKPVAVFALILFILILPFKAFTYYNQARDLEGRVLGISESAVSNLTAATTEAANLNFKTAEDKFSQAGYNFSLIKKQLVQIKEWLAILGAVIPNKKIKLAAQAAPLAQAGQLASRLGQEMSGIFSSLSDVSSPAAIIEELDKKIIFLEAQARQLNLVLKKIKINSLPPAYQPTFSNLKTRAARLEDGFFRLKEILALTKLFFGFSADKRYLLVFQNNAELRATGGFVGSFALLDFSQGKIKNLETPAGGSYDTEAGLYDLIAAPEPLQLVRSRWYFWDANWWPDWPMSARKLAWFYEHSDGPSVDGVISFTPTVMERLLKVIGPIDMTKEYGVVIDADNFWPVVQNFSEQKPPLTDKPKKIISDLLKKIITEIPARSNRRILIDLLRVADSCLAEKHILFYFFNPELQKTVEVFGWDGKVKKTAWDYLMVVDTNIAGGKTDRVIKEKVDLNTEIEVDGTAVNELRITRRHIGEKGEKFVGIRNVDWLRIYVPAGSELVSAAGFIPPPEKYFKRSEPYLKTDLDIAASEGKAEIHWPSGLKIYQEFNKTVFAGWTQVDPGQTITLYLKYRLPFKIRTENKISGFKAEIENFFNPATRLAIPYALLVQKQPGVLDRNFSSRLILPASWQIIDRYPKDAFTTVNGWQIESNLDTDKFWAIVLSHK